MSEFTDASYIEHLESEITKLQAQITELQEEIKRLLKEKGLSGPREGLTFNDRTGLWADDSGRHYCPRCLDNEKRNPLKKETRGWRCTVCAHYYSNPDAPPFVIPPERGPTNW